MNSPTQSTVTISIASLSSCTEHRLFYRAIQSSHLAFEKPAKCPVPSVLLEGYGRDGDRLLLRMHRRKTKGKEHKMESRKICHPLEVFSPLGAQDGSRLPVLGDTQTSIRRNSEQLIAVGSVLSRDWMR